MEPQVVPKLRLRRRVHFDVGGAQNAQFIEYESDEQFAPLATRLATIAAEEVQLYRERFATTNATALVLVDGGRAWFDRGVALGLAGDAVRSREMFARHITQFEEGNVKWRTPSSIRRNDRAIALTEIVDDQDTFRDAIRNDVRTARSMLKLDPAITLPF